jgi:hypothetical protein
MITSGAGEAVWIALSEVENNETGADNSGKEGRRKDGG